MNEQVEQFITGISNETFEKVAREILGEPNAVIVGTPSVAEINTSHNDARTIGIVKVSGDASVSNESMPWSSVVKIIDPAALATSGDTSWVSVDLEYQVYELGLLSDPGVPLRPAKCYLAEVSDADIRTLWLEDLSGATQPPWGAPTFIAAAYHLGRFDGHYSQNRADLPFEIPTDVYSLRWGEQDFVARTNKLRDPKYSNFVNGAFADISIDVAEEFASLAHKIFHKAKSVPHGLSFGDSHARNLFPGESETVGIDWAGLANEPLGADIGVLIGSGLTFGISEARMITDNETAIYDSYISGLKYSGWHGDLTDVRIGFYAQFAWYMATISTFGIQLLEFSEERREWIEKRLGVKFEDVPGQLAPAMALLPKYIDDLKRLLSSTGAGS
jgi:hypothetical protein